jgi:hypothetical protein
MKGLISILMFMLAFAVVDVAAQRKGETTRVQVNTAKRLPRSGLNIRFVELVDDSRCPADTNCVWAGNAQIKIRVTKNGRSHDLTLDTNGPKNAARAEGYSIKLTRLTPEPRSNIRINRNGYVATLEVLKLSR